MIDSPELLDSLFNALMEWDRKPSKASGKRFEKILIEVLARMLGRKPTEEEIKRACR